MAALSPSERGVGSFNDADKLPAYGARDLHVGYFDGREYIAGILFPLDKIPEGSKITYVALELTGLSDSNLFQGGDFTVDMLDSKAADEWRNLTFETLKSAPATSLPEPWRIPSDELAPRQVNVIEFDEIERAAFIDRLDEDYLAFRITGPGPRYDEDGDLRDNLFTWDSGYGEGFGTRPVLRVGIVPPPPTPGPAPGEPTEVPLVIWVAEPTEAPTSTPLPPEAPALLRGKILFLSDRFGREQLMVLDPESGQVGQVTKEWPYALGKAQLVALDGVTVSVSGRPCGSGATPVVDDDNKVIVEGDPARDCTQLVVSRPDLPEPMEVTEPGHLHYEPALSPDGQWIAYVSTLTGSDELFKVRIDGTDNTRLTDNEWAWDKHPSWSPDGSQIVFWSNRDGRQQLYIMNADGSNVHNVSNSAYNDYDPVWLR